MSAGFYALKPVLNILAKISNLAGDAMGKRCLLRA